MFVLAEWRFSIKVIYRFLDKFEFAYWVGLAAHLVGTGAYPAGPVNGCMLDPETFVLYSYEMEPPYRLPEPDTEQVFLLSERHWPGPGYGDGLVHPAMGTG